MACLAQDPGGLGGMVIRARTGPARDALLSALPRLPLPIRKIHPTISDDQLFGGINISATLAASQVIENDGLFSHPRIILATMAERIPTDLAAKLAQHLDAAIGSALILLDEGAEPDERAPKALTDRLAFHVDLDGLRIADMTVPAGTPPPVPAGTDVKIPYKSPEILVSLAARFGIDSLRAPLLALSCARAHAAMNGRTKVTDDDLTTAATLVYPSRATRIPEDAAEDLPAPLQDQSVPDDAGNDGTTGEAIPAEMMVEAVKALLPPGLLDGLVPAGTGRRSGGSGAGQKRKGNRRGRPLPSRSGRLDGRARIDLVATLRAAAPWQPLRRRTQPDAPGLLIRSSDIRLRRFEETSDRLLIFTVDASGSAAVSRLGEAKGAVELLLGEAYARRDHVALIAFRGEEADLLLPPTRSLVQTKRRLAALPGGGGTPLAAGLKAAAELSLLSRSKGLTPTVVLMTDGRANIALDGTPDRQRAAQDSETLATALRLQSVPGLMIDMSNRPQPALKSLAATLGAPYLPLPRADAARVSAAVTGALSEA
ncbi:magnesium chelatase ATPase subunit D (plasmid) [Thalassococcus sp. S3]|nr:magnesium chelatase subunit D [Thalassococcus sp. S3]QBF34151.1 magnesium chelatase ATPase subunit D [Thalassococcus sp. S3]